MIFCGLRRILFSIAAYAAFFMIESTKDEE